MLPGEGDSVGRLDIVVLEVGSPQESAVQLQSQYDLFGPFSVQVDIRGWRTAVPPASSLLFRDEPYRL